MWTEKAIASKLDGHFYSMRFGKAGPQIIDLARGDRLEDDEDALPVDAIASRAYAKPRSIDWTDKDQIILDMRRNGKQFKEIARVLGVNKATVAWRFKRLCDVMGVDPQIGGPYYAKYNPQIEAEIVTLRQSGLTFKAIGERYGMSKASVCTLYYRAFHREKNRVAA